MPVGIYTLLKSLSKKISKRIHIYIYIYFLLDVYYKLIASFDAEIVQQRLFPIYSET